MPYIDPDHRPHLDAGATKPEDTGELNYVITRVVIEYVKRKGMSYATASEARAALADASAEFYRRIVAPYEDAKIRENGDVYSELASPGTPPTTFGAGPPTLPNPGMPKIKPHVHLDYYDAFTDTIRCHTCTSTAERDARTRRLIWRQS